MLKMHNVSKVYCTSDTQTTALDGVNLEIKAGEFVAVMGPSGSGKSTLLNLMGLLDPVSGGRYDFLDMNVTHYPERQLARIRKQHIGFIFQNNNLVDDLTVAENINLALHYRNLDRRDRKRRVAQVMDHFGIAHRAGHLPGNLSGGQQQITAVARAVVGDQSLILADEPTGSLDSEQGGRVMAALQDLNRAGTTIVMVTHSPAHADYARRTINLFDGRVVAGRLHPTFSDWLK